VKITHLPILLIPLLAGQFPPLLAGEVMSWRQGGNGLYPGAQTATDWAAKGNVVWATPVSARGNGCPILVGGKLFFTAEPATLICADAATGKILWEKANDYSDLAGAGAGQPKPSAEAVAQAKEAEEKAAAMERDLYRDQRRLRREPDNQALKASVEELKQKIAALKPQGQGQGGEMKNPRTNDSNGYASYTPVSDGKHVWACFGTGVVVCFDLEGNRAWHKRTENPDHEWGGATSPTLVDGKLIVRFTDYLALDPKTGNELWRTPSAGVTFNCPANFVLDGRHYLYTARGELIRASDGKSLPSQGFTVKSKPWAFFNTPSVIGNRIYCAHGAEGEHGDAYAMEIPKTADLLEKDGLKEVWHQQVNKNRYYSSPLVSDGIVYLITREYQMQALDAADGKELYSQKIQGFTGTAYPSLTLAGKLIFVGAEDGNAAFVKPGRTFEELSRTKVEPFRSTPIFDGALTFLRTQENLLAIRNN
jgi:outer membrane protein assembly factor BamB